MDAQQSGLIVNVSSFAGSKYPSNVAYGVAKAAVDRMAIDMPHELRKFRVAVASIWAGVVTTEMFLKRRKGKSGKWHKVELLRIVGRAIVALATDSNVMVKSGQILPTRELAGEYCFTDVDGNQPRL